MDIYAFIRGKLVLIVSAILGLSLSVSAFSQVKGHSLYDLTYYYGKGGTFVDIGSGRWVENNRDGTFYFDETGRDEWSVYVKRGDMRLKLDMWTRTIDINRNGGWQTLYVINQANAINSVSTNDVVTLFQHGNYGGYAVRLPVGNFKLSDLQRRGMRNDDISSFKIPSGYEVTLYEEDNFQTLLSFFGIPVSGGWSDTYRSNVSFIGSHRNDEVSSVRVKRISNQDTSWWLDCDGFYGYFELLAQDYPITDECD